jgi:hypothetical protein
MTQGQLDLKALDRLLSWLAVHVFLLATACRVAGVLKDLVPILTHSNSGFSGAAFAVMRSATTPRERETNRDH